MKPGNVGVKVSPAAVCACISCCVVKQKKYREKFLRLTGVLILDAQRWKKRQG